MKCDICQKPISPDLIEMLKIIKNNIRREIRIVEIKCSKHNSEIMKGCIGLSVDDYPSYQLYKDVIDVFPVSYGIIYKSDRVIIDNRETKYRSI